MSTWVEKSQMADDYVPPSASLIPRQENLHWRVKWQVEKYATEADYKAGKSTEVVIGEGNMTVYGGYSAVWNRLVNSSPTVTVFDNTNAFLGVGDSSTAAALTQTDLQASSNKLRKAMDATYPIHTDSTSSGGASLVFRATFGSSDANFAWAEWGIFNASSAGRMLNRKVTALGTKGSGATWVFTVTFSN